MDARRLARYGETLEPPPPPEPAGAPARVCGQCGEQLFAPDTVARLQQIARGGQPPQRIQQTPVFDFAVAG